jgi:hypothetical protein
MAFKKLNIDLNLKIKVLNEENATVRKRLISYKTKLINSIKFVSKMWDFANLPTINHWRKMKNELRRIQTENKSLK